MLLAIQDYINPEVMRAQGKQEVLRVENLLQLSHSADKETEAQREFCNFPKFIQPDRTELEGPQILSSKLFSENIIRILDSV